MNRYDYIFLGRYHSESLIGNRPASLAEFVRCLHGLTKVSGLKSYAQLDKVGSLYNNHDIICDVN